MRTAKWVVLQKVQILTTFDKKADNDSNPKTKHILFTYDETKIQPRYNGPTKRRQKPLYAFLIPDKHLQGRELGLMLLNAGIKLVKGGYMSDIVLTRNADVFYGALYGGRNVARKTEQIE